MTIIELSLIQQYIALQYSRIRRLHWSSGTQSVFEVSQYCRTCNTVRDGLGYKADEFSENFQRGGGGIIFNPKIYIADFGPL